VAVDAPDDRASNAKERLRRHDPSAVDETVTTDKRGGQCHKRRRVGGV